ncbi:MAG: hypothetical protein ABI700_06510, partial [Chloroflexota bacterium]
ERALLHRRSHRNHHQWFSTHSPSPVSLLKKFESLILSHSAPTKPDQISGQLSAISGQHYLSTHHSALSFAFPQSSVLSPQSFFSAFTQHSALGTQHLKNPVPMISPVPPECRLSSNL